MNLHRNPTYQLLREQGWSARHAKEGALAHDFILSSGLRFRWEPEDMPLRDVFPDDTEHQLKQLYRQLDTGSLYHDCIVLGDFKASLGSVLHDGSKAQTLPYEVELALDFVREETTRLGVNPLDYARVAELYHGITKG